jgi:hypothetical protein
MLSDVTSTYSMHAVAAWAIAPLNKAVRIQSKFSHWSQNCPYPAPYMPAHALTNDQLARGNIL